MLELRSILVCGQKTKGRNGTSLVLQWTRLCLPTRGHGLHLWSGKSPGHDGTGALVSQLLQAVPLGACSPSLRKPRCGRWSLGAQSPTPREKPAHRNSRGRPPLQLVQAWTRQ